MENLSHILSGCRITYSYLGREIKTNLKAHRIIEGQAY